MRKVLVARLWRLLGYDIVPPTLRSTQDEWEAYTQRYFDAFGGVDRTQSSTQGK